MKVIKAPNPVSWNNPRKMVFLAGSIEMGKAVDWQTQVTNALADMDVTVLNPRRDDWDSSWKQEANNPQFAEQVNWELDALQISEVIAMYFDPATMSPISLLELGLHSGNRNLIVCCPEGFWRKGNVDIVCKRNSITQVDTIEQLIKAIRQRLN
jgi:hypothetical protein